MVWVIAMPLQLKRVYDKSAASDGVRILVDRLWPRALSKEKARVDLWLRDIAPSGELRRWFAHDPARWDQFCQRYRQELDGASAPVRRLVALVAGSRVTLLYAARDAEHNNAVALRDYLARRRRPLRRADGRCSMVSVAAGRNSTP